MVYGTFLLIYFNITLALSENLTIDNIVIVSEIILYFITNFLIMMYHIYICVCVCVCVIYFVVSVTKF